MGNTVSVRRVQPWAVGLKVRAKGNRVIAHAGAAAPRLLADAVGLTGGLSRAMGGAPAGGYDRGRVLADAATALCDGADGIRGMDVLSVQDELYAGMASRSTMSRVISDETDEAKRAAIEAARAQVREWVWDQITAVHGQIPAARTPGGDLGEQIVLRVDATFIETYSRKQGAASHRGTFGVFPLNVYCDNTGEYLTVWLRAGNAGANNADDHITVLTEAIFTQLPARFRHNLLITIDGAGATHKTTWWLHELTIGHDTGSCCGPHNITCGCDRRRACCCGRGRRNVEFSIGWAIDRYTGPVIAGLPEQAWTPMLKHDGTPGVPATLDTESGPDTVGEVAEITHQLPQLSAPGPSGKRRWPPGLRVFIRRMKPLRDTDPKPLPGLAAQLELDGVAETAAKHAAVTGWRYEAFATNTPTTSGHSPDWLDARHRTHARVEDRIRCGHDLGAKKLPFHEFTANAAWLVLHAIAADLQAWLKLLTCHDLPQLAKAEPKTLQRNILHAPALITRGGRQRQLNFPPNWPWTRPIITIFDRINALPAPTG